MNPTESESYNYDELGNRLTSITQDDWRYNRNNQLLSYGATAFSYDKSGNMVEKRVQGIRTSFTWTVDNRLSKVEDDQGLLGAYGYDPFGRRLWKEVKGVRVYFLYSDEGLAGEYNAAGKELRAYGYHSGSPWSSNPLFMRDNNKYYWYQNDHLGTPQKLMAANGTIVWSARYDAFGRATVDVAEVENNLRFPGQYFDAETGLHYNWNRFYDPSSGRYLSADPIGLDGGMNLYAYVQGNPVNAIDPMGLWDWHDFVNHYQFGDGSTLHLSSIGLLDDFVNSSSVQGALGRVEKAYKSFLKSMLFAKCSDCGGTVSGTYDVSWCDESYDVTSESSALFAIGDGELFNKGTCSGTADCDTGHWQGSCKLHFYIRDWFKEPYDIPNLETGTPYRIHGDWNETFNWSE